MKKIKKTLSAILAIALVVCLAGCTSVGGNKAFFIRQSTDYELPDAPAGILMNPGKLVYADIKSVNEVLNTEFPEEEIFVVPVYSNGANVFANDEIIFIYGIDSQFASHLGLEEMKDGTAYFATEQSGELELEISVLTEETPDGVTFGEIDYMTLGTQTGVSEKGLLKVLRDECFTPSMLEEQVCFVTTETFLDIASMSLGSDVNSFEEAEKASGIIEINGMYISAENAEEVKACLEEHKYR